MDNGRLPRRAGVLERAPYGGTLLLDEVSDMPLETQGKIVRALQEQTLRTHRRFGAAMKVDIRVLATSNRDLQAEITAGRFREDLYYRLAVVPLRLPGLARTPGRYPRTGPPSVLMARSAENAGMPGAGPLSADAHERTASL